MCKYPFDGLGILSTAHHQSKITACCRRNLRTYQRSCGGSNSLEEGLQQAAHNLEILAFASKKGGHQLNVWNYAPSQASTKNYPILTAFSCSSEQQSAPRLHGSTPSALALSQFSQILGVRDVLRALTAVLKNTSFNFLSYRNASILHPALNTRVLHCTQCPAFQLPLSQGCRNRNSPSTKVDALHLCTPQVRGTERRCSLTGNRVESDVSTAEEKQEGRNSKGAKIIPVPPWIMSGLYSLRLLDLSDTPHDTMKYGR